MSYENPTGDDAAVALTIEIENRRFLRSVFTMARDGIKAELAEYPDQLKEPEERLRREEVVYGQLLAALDGDAIEPSADIRRVLGVVAESIDSTNEYERVLAEHDALAALRRQLGGAKGEDA